MKNWSRSTQITVALVVLLFVGLIVRSANLKRVARIIAHETISQRSLDAARPLIIKQRLARLFKDRTDQAKKQAIRTVQTFAADRNIVEVDDHHIPMAQAAAATIVEFLSDLELPVRAAAADALTRMGKPAARPLIDTALTSPDKDVRSNATAALREIGEVAVPEMIDAIKSGTPSQKVGCAGAIGRLKSPRAIASLISSLSAEEVEVRLACRDALVAMEESAVDALITALDDANAFTRQHAAEALGEIADPAAAAPLLAALNDDNRLVRLAATYAVGKVGSNTATTQLIARLGDEDREMREAAAVSLGQIADPRAVDPLVTGLSDRVDKVREASAAALGRLGTEAVRALPAIEAASRDADEGIRLAAVFALGRIGSTSSLGALTARVDNDPSALVRQRAARALGDLRSPAAIPALIAAFDDADWRVSYAAQEGLAALGQQAVAPLLTTLQSPDLLAARYARKALVRMDPPPVRQVEVLTGASNPPATRLNATIALGEMNAPEADALLETLSTDTDGRVAEAARQGLIVRGTPAVGAEALAPAVVNGDNGDSEAATEADATAVPAPEPAPAD